VHAHGGGLPAILHSDSTGGADGLRLF